MSLAPLSSADYKAWLDDYVWVDGITKERRGDVLREFTVDLVQRLRKMGYPISPEYNPYKCVCRWMYMIHTKCYVLPSLKYSFDGPVHRNWAEDRTEFDYTMSDFVDLLKEDWSEVEDFDEDSPVGREIWCECLEFVYHLVNVDMSANAAKVEYMLFGTESDGSDEEWSNKHVSGRRAFKKADDVYNQEASQGLHAEGRRTFQ